MVASSIKKDGKRRAWRAPDFERQDFVDESAVAHVADLFVDIGLEPSVEACLPKMLLLSGDEVDGQAFVRDPHGDVADVAVEVIGKGGLDGGERPGVSGEKVRKRSTSLSRRSVPLAWEPASLTDSRYLSNFICKY